ncbi:unnamed protein product [Prorocentrum cordatum]|uniref:Protein kinase domain-containing protein n=1 Tax=Prorocentrum cordatum TaxID=2364126 RepID=A0ABN9WVB9_9DINO|nr:unnamed protein product [Polarella glacialis]
MGASSAGQGFEDRYELQEELGAGSFGQVRAAISIKRSPASTQKAVKFPSTQHRRDSWGVDEEVLRAAKQEAKLWRKIGKHPHCIELLRTFSEGGVFMMVAEKADASLTERLREVRNLPQEGLLRIARDMISGVAHCHKRRVVHRDIKLDNFLICGAAGAVKLCDFGLSARMPRGGGLLYGTHGTAPYMSVEMILNRGHDTSADMWSFGVNLYVLLYGEFPYKPKTPSSAAMKQAVVTGVPLPTFRDRGGADRRELQRPQQLVSLTKRMLERHPSCRCSAADALSTLSPAAPSVGLFSLPAPPPSLPRSPRGPRAGAAPATALARREALWAGAVCALVGSGWKGRTPSIVKARRWGHGAIQAIRIVGVMCKRHISTEVLPRSLCFRSVSLHAAQPQSYRIAAMRTACKLADIVPRGSLLAAPCRTFFLFSSFCSKRVRSCASLL